MGRAVNRSLSGERCREARQRGRSLDWLKWAQVRPGHAAEIVDWSPWGALLDTVARLPPGAIVALQLQRVDARVVVRGLVLRSCVANIGPGGAVRYRTAIRFQEKVMLGHMPQDVN